MRLSISHRTDYSFDEPIEGGLQQLRLIPRSGPSQHIDTWDLTVEGGTTEAEFEDHHANRVRLVSVEAGTSLLRIEAAGTVTTTDTNGVHRRRGRAPLWLYQRDTELTMPGPQLTEFLAAFTPSPDPIETLHALSAHVLAEVSYAIGSTDVSTSAETALEAGRGVCQDHTHIMIAAARQLGFSARYVSGYLFVLGEADQQASHAWAEVWVEDIGWLSFDVVNGICPDNRYVRLAVGLDYSEASPTIGIKFGDSNEVLAVDVNVQLQQ